MGGDDNFELVYSGIANGNIRVLYGSTQETAWLARHSAKS